ncbi:MAG: stage VI sporulation protein F [Firmicutes bacterium]|nr:stage VI sporulation protein F [Bacillota bacterium]
MKFGEEFFKKVEKKTNVSKDTILSLAEKLQKGNMKDEKTLSEVIDTLSKMTGKKVSEEQKSKIIKKVVEDKVPNNVEKMF